jgi:short-subunit dehydrogenase
MVARVRRTWGRIDILINNAGTIVPGPVAQLKAKDLEAMVRVNVFGALFMMQAVLPVMRSQRRGTIINIASLAGRRGVTPLGGYCATKFALVGLTEALRTEAEAKGIHIGLVLPGVVDTPMAQRLHHDTRLPDWPAMLDMPPEWVVAAILLAVRFRLREISVPPGAATLEIIGELAPRISDALIRWTTAAGRLIARGPRNRRAAASK